MGIELSDTSLCGYRSQDLIPQTEIDKDTLFAVQRNGVSAQRLSYSELSSNVKDYVADIMQVGSMAFEESWQYSKLNHNHGNYTNIQVTSYPISSELPSEKIGTLSVGDTPFEGISAGHCEIIDIYCPIINNDIPKEPAYGTLRFAYSYSHMPAVIDDEYIRSGDFDGWVYPNGSQFTIIPAQFTKAGNRFVTYDTNPYITGDKLTVPDLKDRFFKLNPFVQRESVGRVKKCSFVERLSHNAIPRHTHPIENLDASIRLTADFENSTFKYSSSSSKYNKNYVHNGSGKEISGSPFSYTATINFAATQIGLQTEPYQQSPINNYPSHWAMPVMIYVGGRLKEYERMYLT